MPEAGRTTARSNKRGAVVCALAGALLLTAGAGWAAVSAHDPWRLREVRVDGIPLISAFGQCTNCHTLDPNEGDVNTGYINRNARTLPQMRAFGGVPDSFGCTFCHSDVTDNEYMKNGLKDYEYTAPGRKHPVGVTIKPGAVNNNNEYFSTFNTTSQVDQLQCIQCHDPALLFPGGLAQYPQHEGRVTDNVTWRGTWDKTVNPYALRNVAALGEERNRHCAATCHGAAVPDTPTTPRMGHVGWGGYREVPLGSGVFKIFEPRGTEIRQSDCGVCHDAHNSTEEYLLGDGLHTRAVSVNPPTILPDIVTAPEAKISDTNCTVVCHEGGLATSNFETKGHGKPRDRELTRNMNYNCSGCHDSGVPHRDPVNPKRFGIAIEDTADSGVPHNGSSNQLDDNYNGQVDEPAEAAWYNSATSICQGCHSEYSAHGGNLNGAGTTHYVRASCLDCHDPHGNDLGTNIEMIRTSIAGEPTVFQFTTDNGTLGNYDFYRVGVGVDNGVCDNTTCHGGRTLETILADPTITDHVGITKGANCTGCHTHTSPTTAPSFFPRCDTCHGNPPASGGLQDYQQGIGVHERHVTDLGIPCNECHYRTVPQNGNAHNESNWEQNPGYSVPRGNVDVVFNTHGGTVNVGASYSGFNSVTGIMDTSVPGAIFTCNNITCHNPDTGRAGVGLTGKAGTTILPDKAPAWADAFAPITTCIDTDGAGPLIGCHVESPATNPDGGSHFKHDSSIDPDGAGPLTAGKAFPCQICHDAYYDATDTFNIAGGRHSNGSLDTTGVVAFSGTLNGQAVNGNWAEGAGTCANAYCHGDTLPSPDVPTPAWGSNVPLPGGRCGDCHDTDLATDTTAPTGTIATGNHTAHLTAAFGPNTPCASCHPAYALNGANHVNGLKDFINLNNTTVTTFALTDTCNNCHGTSTANAKDPTNWGNVPPYKLPCVECHDGSANSARGGTGVIAQNAAANWATTGHGRPASSGTYNQTLHGQNGPGYACTVCHDQASAHINGTLGTTDRFLSVADDLLDHTSKVSEVCLDCHKPGQSASPGPVNHLNQDSVAEASVHSGAMTQSYNTALKAPVAFPAYGNAANYLASPGYQCDACHDPHGTSKLAMVKPILNGRLGAGAENAPINVGAGFDYATGTLGGLDPTSGANDGVCDACHRITGGNTNAHPDSVKINNHNQPQVCVNCHDHEKSFYAGCSDCHGGGLTGTSRMNYWPDGSTAAPGNVAGAHLGHITDLAQRIYGLSIANLLNDAGSDVKQKHLCKYCHGTNPGMDVDHALVGALPAEVSPNLGRLWDVADPPAQTDAVTYNNPPGTLTCAAVECHYNTTTTGWLSGTPATCTTCHNNGTNNGALLNSWPNVGTPAVGDHYKHYTTAMSGVLTDCSACHTGTTPADMSAVATVTTHINGNRYSDVSIPVAFNDKSEGTADSVAYTPGVTPNENNGTCANVSCHGGSAIGITPPWRAELPSERITTTTVITAECQKCHQRVDGNTNPLGTEYNDARSGAHVDHSHGCEVCHSAAPGTHYGGIATIALDNPDGIGSVAYSVEYTDTTIALNVLTNGFFNDATTALGVSGTCATVTCHYNASPAWDVDLTASCGLCHLDSPTTNAHQAHVYGGSTPDHTDCDQCHPSVAYAVAAGGTDPSFIGGTHATGTMVVDLLPALTPGGTPGAARTCTTNPCHVRETLTTTWDNATSPLTCNSCHYAPNPPTAAASALGNPVGPGAIGGTHNPHFFGAPTNIVCGDCHTNPTGDTGGVLGKRTHMKNTGATDGLVLLNKAQATQEEGDVLVSVMNVAGDSDPGNPTCNVAVCHNPTPGAAYAAVWNGPANSLCNFCHADAAGVPASGSHAVHINYAAGYAPCAQCHPDNGAVQTHMTRSVELTAGMSAGYTALLTPPYTNASWGSCSAGACHDTDQDPAWGGAVPANDCYRCHINNNATPASSTDLPNFAGSDRVASQISIGAEWSVRGHGAKVPPANTCVGCHDGVGVGHQPDLAASGNPFRLASYTIPNNNPDAFCSNLSCHTGLTVPGSNLVISHTYELMNTGLRQRTWPSWRPKCFDCHDPHGDAGNLNMVATDLFDRGSSTHGVPTATLNSIPRTADLINFTVQGGIGAGSYAQTPGADGVCQECHLANDGVATNLVSFQDDNATPLAGNHPTASISPCTQCHKHDKAFEPAGCNGCHGNTVTKQYWPDGAGGSPAYADDSAGAHDNHIAVISQRLYGQTVAQLLLDPAVDARQKTICSFCHPDPGGNGHNTNNGVGNYANTADLWFDGQNNAGGAGNNFKAFKVGAGTWGDDAGAAQASYDNVTETCNNVDCHNEYPTPVGWNVPPVWTAGNAACSNISCHATGSYTVAHTAHVADKLAVAAGNGNLCTECHVDNGTNLRHENGQVDMSFSIVTSVDRQFGAATTGYYDKDFTQGGGNVAGAPTAGDTGFAYKNGTYARTCYNLYCHGADSTWRGADPTPVWDNPNTATCYGASTCHNAYGSPYDQGGVARNGITTGSHQKHMIQWTSAAGVEVANPTGPRMAQHPNSLGGSSQHNCSACHNLSQGVCTDCHNGITGSGASLPTLTHADGRIDFTGAITGPAGFSVAAASIAATNACDECHGGPTPASTAKANWATVTLLPCEFCHGDYAVARSRRNIGWPPEASVDAPQRAGAIYDTAGHGKVTDHVTYGGRGCPNCHDFTSQHFTQRTNTIAPVLGDMNRARIVGGNDYNGNPNGYCGVCHAAPQSIHYTNAQTPGNGSDDGNRCAICHDPHGQSGQDAMVGGTVASRTVSGFTNRTFRSSYFNAGNTGVCQVCHDPAEVPYYNRTSGATDTHNPGPVCTQCHKHNDAVAFQFNCSGCHGDIAGATRDYPPEGPTAARNPGGQTWVEAALLPNTVGDHQLHDSHGMGACNNCHTATPGIGATHNDNSINATMTQIVGYGSWNPGVSPGTTSVVDDYCTITCHNSLGFPGVFSPANPTYVRYWNSNLDCYSCHAFDGAADSALRPGNQTAVSADWMASGSHDVHINRSTGYALACTNCHVDNTGNNTHRNGNVGFTANFGAARIPGLTGGNYDDTGTAPFVTVSPVPNTATSRLYCGNLYCHSTGEPRGTEPRVDRAATRWSTSTTADCGTCHAVDGVAGTTLLTNVHEKHTGSALGQYTISCTTCHATVVNAARAITSLPLHVNGTNDVAFAASEGAYTGGVFPAGGTCSATYCHSQGLDWTVPFTMAAANAPLVQPDWDVPFGATACFSCHGNGATIAYPIYNNLPVDPGGGIRTKFNSHVQHQALSCNYCHNATTTDGSTIASPANHTNKAWDLQQGGGATFSVSIQGNMNLNVYTPTTCTLISCHNGGTAQWGATLKCTDCHFAAADVNNWVITDGTPSAISSTEWTTSGHGRTTAFPGANPAANFGGTVPATDTAGCAYCHNAAVPHQTSANPFRLTNRSGTAEDQGWNYACLICHKALDPGYNPGAGYATIDGTVDVDENHYSTPKHTAPTMGGAFCWDCHDPHGDASHLMVQATATVVSDGLTGLPASVRTVTPLDVVGGGYTSGDLVNAGFTGLCQTCHAPAGGANWYNQTLNTPLASHNGADGTLCTECHPHGQDFAPRTCESCHNGSTPYVKGTATAPNVMGNGSSAAGTGATPKPYNDGAYGYNVDGHGRDDNPAAPGNAINLACIACHDLSQANGTHINGVNNGRLSPDTRSANSFFLLSSFVSAAAPTSDHQVQVTFDNACATLCHGVGIDMRHAKDAVPAANAVQFGTHASYSAPQNVPPPTMFYDRHLKSAAAFGGFDGGTNFALCVSCHDPHGTSRVIVGPRADLNNKMMLYEWSNPSTLCAQCHL